jgi:hypothetical protein
MDRERYHTGQRSRYRVMVQKARTVASLAATPTVLIWRKMFNYDVAISFAGEQRKEAEAITDCLKKNEVKVFYDGYEKADLAYSGGVRGGDEHQTLIRELTEESFGRLCAVAEEAARSPVHPTQTTLCASWSVPGSVQGPAGTKFA